MTKTLLGLLFLVAACNANSSGPPLNADGQHCDLEMPGHNIPQVNEEEKAALVGDLELLYSPGEGRGVWRVAVARRGPDAATGFKGLLLRSKGHTGNFFFEEGGNEPEHFRDREESGRCITHKDPEPKVGQMIFGFEAHDSAVEPEFEAIVVFEYAKWLVTDNFVRAG